MFLLIDWGNSLLKYIIVDEISFDAIKRAEINHVDKLEDLADSLTNHIQQVLITSVRNEKDNLALKNVLLAFSKSLFWASTADKVCGVSCAYSQPKQLGVDRWLAVLAADLVASKVAVISVGSAITLDLVEQHQHLGGQIVPGIKLLLASLAQTGQVKADEFFEQAKQFELGRSTTACVHQGVETLIASYIRELVHQCQQQQVDKIIFCGGGGADWAANFAAENIQIEHQPRLVFQGLLRLYLESNSNH